MGKNEGYCSSGERMKNKLRGVGDKTAHWPRIRLTTLLLARPFLLASGQSGHLCFEREIKKEREKEKDCEQQSQGYGEKNEDGETEKRKEISKRFLTTGPGN